jgi:hypothetical protein
VNLVINTTALDKSQACCASISSLTPLTALQDLTLGDNEPLSLTFTDGAGGPSWAGTAGYTPTFSLGLMDPDGLSAYAQTVNVTPFTGASGNGWIGRIALNTQALIDNLKQQVGSAVDWTRFPYQNRQPGPRPKYGWYDLQIGVTDPSGNFVSYADVRVIVRSRVVFPNTGTTGQSGLVGGVGGNIGATNGASSQPVLFSAIAGMGAGFANACNMVQVDAVGPTGAVINAGAINITKNGFTAVFASSIPAAGWTLYVSAAGS